LGNEEQAAIAKASNSVAVIQAANFSVGVNLLLALTSQVASVLGNDYDIEVLEMHHRHKVDAPSGTALALGQAAANGRDVDLGAVSERVRDGQTGARSPGNIGFATLRGGDVVGDHSLIFAADGERIELNHKASSRTVFARGAVRSAKWCENKAPGLYSMRDVLGL
jgi:4-hydroxy-tetrahydrodipicolinate reductase